MPEESKLATASHIAQIVGLIPSFVCMWAVVFPSSQTNQPPSSGNQPMPRLLLISLICALTCFLIGGILQLVVFIQRRRKAPGSLSPVDPPWAGYESEQQWRDAITEQNRLVDLGHSVDGLLQPLQIKALRFADDIVSYLRSADPAPNTNYEDKEKRTQALVEHVHWWERLNSGYQLRFEQREKELVLLFSEKNIQMPTLDPTGYAVRGLADRIPLLAAAFISMTYQLSGVSLELKR